MSFSVPPFRFVKEFLLRNQSDMAFGKRMSATDECWLQGRLIVTKLRSGRGGRDDGRR